MSNKTQIDNKNRSSEEGFTMIEMVIAIFVLTIALFGTAAAITFALEFSAISKNVTNGKHVIVSSIEEIETLRNARILDYNQIANVGDVDNTGATVTFGGFSTGFKPVTTTPGADGVYGTDDDPTDAASIREGYTRKIEITELSGSETIKKIEVTVRYEGAADKVGEISSVAYLNNEARLTR